MSVSDFLNLARRAADRILKLPIYDGLELSEGEIMCETCGVRQKGLVKSGRKWP